MSERVLLTGASGFLGSVINEVLRKEFEVVTLGRSSANQIQSDLSVEIPKITSSVDWVVHAAGHAHRIPRSATERKIFEAVNQVGTSNLLRAFDKLQPPKAFVFISSVSVYGCEHGEHIDELYPLTGRSPYAVSKIEAEKAVSSWCAQRNVCCSILRLPLIVGPGAPGNLGKMIRAIRQGWYVGLGDGRARKSVVLATDVANFLPVVKERGGVYNLTDGVHPTMLELENAIARALGRSSPRRLPIPWLHWLARAIGWIPGSPLNVALVDKLSNSLTFDDAKARSMAGWKSSDVIAHIPDVV